MQVTRTDTKTEPIQFQEIGGGFIVGGAIFVELVGLLYLHRILGSDGPIDCALLSNDGDLLAELKSERASSNDREKYRQSVKQAITRAIKKLQDVEATTAIGFHLNGYVKTGKICEYVGDWHWDL